MIKEAIVKIVSKEDLTYEEAYTVMNEIMSGETTPTQNAAFLAALSTKSARAETTDEIAGCAAAMREKATRVEAGDELFEIVGTGRAELQHLHHLGAGRRRGRHARRQAREPRCLQQVRNGGLPGSAGREHPPGPGPVPEAAG